ncbi:hypothetical protein SZ63_05705 [Methanoculleus sediminis]|uniref:Uncharacterized protein n=1 Tax=Methanoculleus sediminis TaxID=1550566 RepID=A0A0H1R005_9EURY|nr:hypothetical protein [Methanoculleus sediminis]KLK88505.1 hypothetical protein SZ63_05705 [Methanoculleus sediminis]
MTQAALRCKSLEEALFDHELEMNLTTAMENKTVKDFSEADGYTEYAKGSGRTAEAARRSVTRKIAQTLTAHLAEGLIQVTVEEMMKEEEYRDAVKKKEETAIIAKFSRDLPPFRAYVDVTTKCGCMALTNIRYRFEAEPNVTVQDAKITLKDDQPESILFGTLVANLTLNLLLGSQSLKICSIKGTVEMPGTIDLSPADADRT